MGAKAKELANAARDTGFAFGNYGDEAGPFGLSISSADWVRKTAAEVQGLEFVFQHPAGWFGHQDVWTFTRTQ
jgi:hypothetical protein